jgi:hypothetical protein
VRLSCICAGTARSTDARIGSQKGNVQKEEIMPKNQELIKAEKALEEFLENNPDMKDYQAEINRRLSKAPTSKGRMEILKFMMAERLTELGKNLTRFVEVANSEIAKKTKELK